jgi:hypothetical protein
MQPTDFRKQCNFFKYIFCDFHIEPKKYVLPNDLAPW